MATMKPFAQAGFLDDLERLGGFIPATADARLPAGLAGLLFTSDGSGKLTAAAGLLIALLKGRASMLQASFDNDLIADELRRYQKFARPGQPSPHIVQLRQKQGAARQAASVSKQSFITSAAAFVRATGIVVPPRVALEAFITRWIDDNVPRDFIRAA